jgi:hypothetical protein
LKASANAGHASRATLAFCERAFFDSFFFFADLFRFKMFGPSNASTYLLVSAEVIAVVFEQPTTDGAVDC